MFASDLKDAKPDGIFGARDITTLKARKKQKALLVLATFHNQLTCCIATVSLHEKDPEGFLPLSHSLF